MIVQPGVVARDATYRVLLIEHAPPDRHLVRRVFDDGGTGVDLRVADRLQAGLAALRADTFDAIIVDLDLPDSAAEDTRSAITEAAPEVPVIVLTGSGAEDADQGAAAGTGGAPDDLVTGPAPLDLGLSRTLRHVVARWRAEKARVASERRFLALAECGPDVVFKIALSEPPRMTYVNQAVQSATGYAPEEFDADPGLFQTVVHPDDRYLLDRLVSGTPVPSFTIRTRARDGTTLSWDTSTATLTEGGAPMVIGVARNVTDQKAAEAALTELQKRFLHAQKMEAVGRLAGGVAHDFNNLLTAIFSFGAFVMEGLAPESESHRDMQELLRAAERAQDLTKQLLVFSRRSPMRPQVVDVNETLRPGERLYGQLLDETIQIEMNLQPDLWRARLDPGLLDQIMMNLVVNACDALDSGGRITIESRNVSLDQDYNDARGVRVPLGDYVMISVADDGVGMDPETQERIFEPFFTTKSGVEGSGLGLSTCHGIVTQAGGVIWCYSEAGRGTTFKLYFPRSVEEPRVEASETPQVAPRGDETILLVEDDAQVRELATRGLTRMGFKVVSAPGGDEAIQAWERLGRPVDLLITDMVMPGMSGRRLAERLAEAQPGMKVLYMSGYTAASMAGTDTRTDPSGMIEKPFTPTQLALKARAVLSTGRPLEPAATRPRVPLVDDAWQSS